MVFSSDPDLLVQALTSGLVSAVSFNFDSSHACGASSLANLNDRWTAIAIAKTECVILLCCLLKPILWTYVNENDQSRGVLCSIIMSMSIIA